MNQSAAGNALVVINRADDETGGSLRAAINVADALAASGVKVMFTAPVSRSISTLEAVNSMHPNVTVKLFRTAWIFARLGGSPRHLLWLIRNVRRYEFVHVHTIFFAAAAYTSLVCKIARVPYFIWPHGCLDGYDLNKHRIPKALTGRTVFYPYLRFARAFLCTTTREADELFSYGALTPREIVPLPVVGLPPFESTAAAWRSKFGIRSEAFVVLFFGRIDPKKGLERLIDAMGILRDEDVMLVLAGVGGDPDYQVGLEKQAAALGVADKVRFLGWLEGSDRTGAYVASDVFALPSDNENFGIAIIESLLMDLPVIISDQVYISETLRQAGAAIIAERSAPAVAEAILGVRDDREEALASARRGHALSLELYSEEAVAGRLRNLVA